MVNNKYFGKGFDWWLERWAHSGKSQIRFQLATVRLTLLAVSIVLHSMIDAEHNLNNYKHKYLLYFMFFLVKGIFLTFHTSLD